jgi:D-alanyl-lipoteichoic acid acyltransferase DltB (MBOAT superfamily)
MGVLSLGFLALVVAATLGFRLLPWRPARRIVLTFANAAFVASFARNPVDLLPLVGFLIASWIGIVLLRRKPNALLLGAWLVITVASFVVLKQYAFVTPFVEFPSPLMTVGLSYVLFRVIHLMVDLGTAGKLEGLTALRFVDYTCNFLTFVSGPIQRFENYVREIEAEQRDRPFLDGDLLLDSGARAIIGLVKSLMAAPIALVVHEWAALALAGKETPLAAAPPAVELSVATLAYLMFLYWNFSGYVDIVIAAGRLIGISLPENFDRPFTSPNFIELWSRWHITLSDWFRFYVFNPIVTALTRFRGSARLAPYYAVFGFLVTFFVMGIWHGTTEIFVFYGLLLGSATALNKLYQVQMRAWLGKQQFKRLGDNALYSRLCNGLCIGFFALALACFWLDWNKLLRLAQRHSLIDLVGALAISSLVTVCLRLLHDLLGRIGTPRVSAVLASRWWRQVWTSFALLMLVLQVALTHSDLPPFVYAEF